MAGAQGKYSIPNEVRYQAALHPGISATEHDPTPQPTIAATFCSTGGLQ
jgi:hypothetical protein